MKKKILCIGLCVFIAMTLSAILIYPTLIYHGDETAMKYMQTSESIKVIEIRLPQSHWL